MKTELFLEIDNSKMWGMTIFVLLEFKVNVLYLEMRYVATTCIQTNYKGLLMKVTQIKL